MAATIAGASRAFFVALADDLLPHLEAMRAAGLLRDDFDLREASEWLVRVMLSLLTVDGPVDRTPDDERRFLATFLVPALVPFGAGVAPAGSGTPS